MSRFDLFPYAAMLLRLSLGALFLAHGLNKLLVNKPSGTVAFFGALLIAGVGTSLVALGLVPLMLGTIAMDHGRRGWMFSNPGGGWEFPAFWSVTLIVQALLGSGAYSLGHAIGIGWL